MAEMKFGAAVGFKDVVMITIGTGIGGAIAINGKILNGTNGMAGELGHVVIERNGKNVLAEDAVVLESMHQLPL